MMDFELKLEKPKVSRVWISAATMGAAYFVGVFPPISFLPPLLLALALLTRTEILSRRLNPNDTINRLPQRHLRPLCLDRHHRRRSPRLRLYQELDHGPYEEECRIWSYSNLVCRWIGSWGKLWHCEGY